ncbi:MAG: hypothetical protein IPJ82_05610 [Lewinellaceae bacterium]|nr:hypothetical protein [Lewinellaceae bacterium]
MKEFYRRSLPHLQPMGGTFFVTFRLAGSLPQSLIQELRAQFAERKQALVQNRLSHQCEFIYQERKRCFTRYDEVLDQGLYGNCYLRESTQSQLVADELHRQDSILYELIAYCIMPNHVHVLFDTSIQLTEEPEFYNVENLKYKPLEKIMQQIKGASSRAVNQSLGRTGQLWQYESYDHWVRNHREFDNILWYILNNPVKAGLVKTWRDWAFNYCRYEP